MSFSFGENEAARLEKLLRSFYKGDDSEDDLLLGDFIEAVHERELIDFEGEDLTVQPSIIAENTANLFKHLRER